MTLVINNFLNYQMTQQQVLAIRENSEKLYALLQFFKDQIVNIGNRSTTTAPAEKGQGKRAGSFVDQVSTSAIVKKRKS